MNEEAPFPAALPAVVPSALGPAISYSNIRAVTSRAERTLDQLRSKVKKRLSGQMNDAGMAGAVIESKVRQRLADQLAPAEQLYQEYTDQIQNQIAGNLAPAVATLEDLGAATGESQRVTTTTQTAGDGTPGEQVFTPPAAVPLTQPTPLRAGGLARQLSRTPGLVAGGPRTTPPPGPCPKNTDPPIPSLQNAFMDWLVQHPQYPVTTASKNYFFYTPNCQLYTEHSDADPPVSSCGYLFFRATEDTELNKVLAAEIVSLFQVAGFNLTYTTITGTGCTPPVDCTVHPLDPACPPDCKTHPEDPRCPPTPPTCPPPCIEVTCPPPIINVPPCPTLTPTECIQIDLCDWDKFCNFIKKCFVESKKECALDNDTAYALADCDGLLISAQTDYFGTTADTLNNARTINDAVMPSSTLTAQLVSVSSCGRDLLADCVPV